MTHPLPPPRSDVARTVLRTSLSVPGVHCWPTAPADAEPLRHPHRHMFNFAAEVQAPHSNERPLEFFVLCAWVREILDSEFKKDPVYGYDFKDQSCEFLARRVGTCLKLRINGRDAARVLSVTVTEDAENGARVEFKH